MSSAVLEESPVSSATENTWLEVCKIDDLVLNSGVCALVNDESVALFTQKVAGELKVFALSGYDPVGQANVISRGLLGSKGDTLFVASPLYKQRYCLETGKCLDDESLSLKSFISKIENDSVFIKLV